MDTMEQRIDALRSGDAQAQSAAAEALAQLAEAAQPAIVALVQSVGSSDEDVRNGCTAALEAVGPPAADQIADLTALASAADNDIAFWAITLLGRAPQLATEAAPILAERLADGGAPAVQQRAAWALRRIEAG